MHYSAKYGIAIACHLSVHLSMMLVDHDHIGWKSGKQIARTISPTPLLFLAQRPSTYSPGEHGEILGRLEVGWEKVACWSTKAAISLKHVKIEEKLLWSAFRMVPSPIPYGLLFPKIGGSQPPPKTLIAGISGTAKATDFKFGRYFHRVHPNRSPLKIWEKRECGHMQGLSKILRIPIYRAHRMVIFVIAKVCCTVIHLCRTFFP